MIIVIILGHNETILFHKLFIWIVMKKCRETRKLFFLVHYTFLFIIRKNMPSVKFKFFIKPIIIVNLVQGTKKLNITIVNVFVTKKIVVIKSFPLFIFQAYSILMNLETENLPFSKFQQQWILKLVNLGNFQKWPMFRSEILYIWVNHRWQFLSAHKKWITWEIQHISEQH